MSLFHRGETYRLADHEEKKEREIRRYKPPRPLSWFSSILVILMALAMLAFGASILVLRYAGTETEALVNTRLNATGEVETVDVLGVTTTVSYTYRDNTGALHAATSSLFGNTEPFGDTIPVRYFPPIPAWNMLSFRTEDTLTPFGALLLGVVLIYTGVHRLRQIKEKAEEKRE